MAIKPDKDIVPTKTYKRKWEGAQKGNDDLLNVLEMGQIRLFKGYESFENTAEGLQKFKTEVTEYFKHIAELNEGAEHPIVPDVESLCAYLGTCRKTLWSYEKCRSEEWQEAIGQVKNFIIACKKQLAFRQAIPPVVFIFDMVNNGDYRNASEFRIEPIAAREEYSNDKLPNLLEIESKPE